MWDIDGNEYIDYVGSWGPAIIGHADDEVLPSIISIRRNRGITLLIFLSSSTSIKQTQTTVKNGGDRAFMAVVQLHRQA
ncbi:hypothetical protein L6452_33637 [Arctium lappa]|uniref:Uncharacterized protein n=1 Tax=Arctium lappa TaxID=4217 RepID=A0ACB8YHK1_ARCLA|nr:hypothetical protein L6452_33637 [Arctium lappa]